LKNKKKKRKKKERKKGSKKKVFPKVHQRERTTKTLQ